MEGKFIASDVSDTNGKCFKCIYLALPKMLGVSSMTVLLQKLIEHNVSRVVKNILIIMVVQIKEFEHILVLTK